MSRRSFVLAFFALLILPLSVYAAVTLKYFRVGEVSDNSVQVEWETATELDTAQFILSRAESQDGPFAELESIPAEGDAVTGDYYEYIDNNVQPGKTYWYKLEEQETNGAKKPAADVISASPGQGQPTAAPTEEGTGTETPPVETPAATATPAPGATEPPVQEPTNTPAPGATEPPVQEPTATAAPVSTEAPAATAVQPPTNTPATGTTSTPVPPPPGGGSGGSSGGNSTLLLIAGIVALIAAAVVGFFAFRMKGGS